jgi:hypothetical protein
MQENTYKFSIFLASDDLEGFVYIFLLKSDIIVSLDLVLFLLFILSTSFHEWAKSFLLAFVYFGVMVDGKDAEGKLLVIFFQEKMDLA